MWAWLEWSQTRLLTILAAAYLLVAESVSALFSDGATCIINPAKYGAYYVEKSECPALHMFLIENATALFEKLGDPNWVIAIAAVVTAIFTVVLGTFTISLARSTRIAAESAQRALTELERPYLFILDYNWLLKEEVTGASSGLAYTVANGGKLPAFIKDVKIGMSFGQSIPQAISVPEINDLLTAPLIGGGERRKITQLIGAEDEAEGPFECDIKGGLAFIPAMAFRCQRVIAKISIEYDGPTTTGHITTACWEWHAVKNAFTQYGGPEHNRRT